MRAIRWERQRELAMPQSVLLEEHHLQSVGEPLDGRYDGAGGSPGDALAQTRHRLTGGEPTAVPGHDNQPAPA